MADKFPSSAAFDAINAAINASDADRKDAIKQGKGVYAFTLKNKEGETASWHIDLKTTGAVATGLGEKPNGAWKRGGLLPLTSDTDSSSKTTVTLSLSDADFANLVAGKGNAQRLFMSGKLKVSGDVMKATKLDPILKKAQTKAKL